MCSWDDEQAERRAVTEKGTAGTSKAGALKSDAPMPTWHYRIHAPFHPQGDVGGVHGVEKVSPSRDVYDRTYWLDAELSVTIKTGLS